MKNAYIPIIGLAVILIFSCDDGSGPFIPVQDITDLPKTATAGQDFTLTCQVIPQDATNRGRIIWNLKEEELPGTTKVSNGILHSDQAQKLVLTATVVQGINEKTSYSRDFALYVNSAFTAVTEIIPDFPETAQIKAALSLSGTVHPPNATNRTIRWSIDNPDVGELRGDTLTIKDGGLIKVTATIAQGASESEDYTQEFSVAVNTGDLEIIPPGLITDPVLTLSPSEPTGEYAASFDCVVSPRNYSSYKWLLDGELREGEYDPVLSIPITTLLKGKHSVTVIVVKNGKPYSATIDFKVNL